MGKRIPEIVILVLVQVYSLFGAAGVVHGAGEGLLADKALHLNIPALSLRYLEKGEVVKEYPIAVGKPDSPTPVGEYRVISKVVYPTWYPPQGGKPVPPGPDNPLGSRWLGLAPGYGIHGTNAPDTIGKAVSLGCVRMNNGDVEELFSLVPRNTPVHITYDLLEQPLSTEGEEMALILYPDIYRRGQPTLKELQDSLGDLGLPVEVWPEETLLAFLQEGEKKPVKLTLPQPGLVLNGKPLEAHIPRKGEEFLLPLRLIAEGLGFAVSWEPEKGAMVEEQVVSGGEIYNGVTYLPLEEMQKLLGVRAHWDLTTNHLELYRIRVTFEDTFLSHDAYLVEDVLYLGAALLAEELDLEYYWDRQREVVILLEEELPGREFEGELYFSLPDLQEKLADKFGLDVFWIEEDFELQIYCRS